MIQIEAMGQSTMARSWQQFFDNHAPHYMENVFTQNTPFEVDFLLEELQVPPASQILDIGCGTGRHGIALAQRGYQVTGVDLSAGMLAEAQRSAAAAGVEATWIQGSATELSSQLPLATFDAVICLCEGAFGLLGTQDDALEQPLAILNGVSHTLKPGGRCLFTVLNGFALARRYKQSDVDQGRFDPLTLSEISEWDPGEAETVYLRERGFVPTELSLLFRMAGLRVIQIWGGTAGNWRRGPIDLDEIEIMVIGQAS